MQDIYNDISSSSDEEELKQAPSDNKTDFISPKEKKKGEYSENDIKSDLEKMEQKKQQKLAAEALKDLYGGEEDVEEKDKVEE